MSNRQRAVLSTRTAPSGDPGQPATPSVVPATGSGGGTPGVGPQPGAGAATVPEMSFAQMNANAMAAAGGLAPAPQPAPAPVAQPGAQPGLVLPPAPVPQPVPGVTQTTPPAPPLTPEQVQEYQQLRREWGNIQSWVQQAQAERAQLLARVNQQPAPAPAPAAQVQTNAFGIPQWDRSLERFLQVDPATRQVTELPGAPAGTLQRYNEYRYRAAEFQERFAANPEEALAPVLGKLREQARQEAEAVVKQQQTQAVANQFIADNQTWLYTRGQDGSVATDYQGNPVLSAKGREFYHIAAQLKTAGVTDMQTVIGITMRAMLGNIHLAQLGQQAPAQPQAPQPQAPAGQQSPGYAPQPQQFAPPGQYAQQPQPQAQVPAYPAMPLGAAPPQGRSPAELQAAANRQAFLSGQAGATLPPVPGGAPNGGPVLPPTPEWGLPDFSELNRIHARHYGLNLVG